MFKKNITDRGNVSSYASCESHCTSQGYHREGIGYRGVTLVLKTGPLAAAVSKLLLKTLALTNDTNACPVFNTELFEINFTSKEL